MRHFQCVPMFSLRVKKTILTTADSELHDWIRCKMISMDLEFQTWIVLISNSFTFLQKYLLEEIK